MPNEEVCAAAAGLLCGIVTCNAEFAKLFIQHGASGECSQCVMTRVGLVIFCPVDYIVAEILSGVATRHHVACTALRRPIPDVDDGICLKALGLFPYLFFVVCLFPHFRFITAGMLIAGYEDARLRACSPELVAVVQWRLKMATPTPGAILSGRDRVQTLRQNTAWLFLGLAKSPTSSVMASLCRNIDVNALLVGPSFAYEYAVHQCPLAVSQALVRDGAPGDEPVLASALSHLLAHVTDNPASMPLGSHADALFRREDRKPISKMLTTHLGNGILFSRS